MLGEFIIKILVLVLGYLYPAFECFKAMEHNRITMEQLKFWCQYWVLVAILTAIEKFGDIFVSWLPLYGEAKLAFIVYLWHPKTQGTRQVYDTFLRPFMADHEVDIDRRMHQIMAKTVDLLVFYFKNFVDKGQSVAFEVLQQVLLRTRGSRPNPPPSEDARRPSVPPLVPDRQDGRRPSPPRPPASSYPPMQPPVPPPASHYPSASPPASIYPSAPPYMQPQAPPYMQPQAPPRPSASYPPVDDYNGSLHTEVNRVEEVLRAGGLNLPGLRRRQ